MDDEARKSIEAILKRGNDAQVQKTKNGIVILEVKREIKYKST